MNTDVAMHRDLERTVIKILRALPPNRAAQLVDFARFLEAQILSEELVQKEDMAEIEADEAQWDALLATDAAQILLENLADEALAEYRAGATRPLAFREGRIVPG